MVKVWFIMKLAVLILIIFFIIIFFRYFGMKKKQANLNKTKENIVDLEKDPETDEYKPKE